MESKLLIRKLRFPLQFKIILLILFLLLSSLTLYVYFAQDLFKKDKSASIFEFGYSSSAAIKNQSEHFFSTILQKVVFLSELGTEKAIFLLQQDNQIYSLSVYSYANSKFNKISDLTREKDTSFFSPDNSLQQRVIQNKQVLFIKKDENQDKNKAPIIIWGYFQEESQKIFWVQIASDNLLKTLEDAAPYTAYLLNAQGEIFLHQDPLLKKSSTAASLFQEIKKLGPNFDQGVKEINHDKIVAFNQINLVHLFAVAEIEKNSAFLAARFLINKSFYFALIILSLSVIIGILFSRRLTANLRALFEAMQTLAQGNFETKMQIKMKGRDETGVLGDAFNIMSQKIGDYMVEMKEKARMENEFKVAQLVQNSFFPPNSLLLAKSNLALCAAYSPATECGGDWWSYLEVNNKTLLFIADATGHGVPAALLTATINCCKSNLQMMAQIRPDIMDDPNKILQFINQAVLDSGGEIMLTCFLGIIDHHSNTMSYANASHNPPLILQADMKSLSLLGEVGPRLGQDGNPQYKNHKINFTHTDLLVLYTDGLIDGQNESQKSYGSRRFLKILQENQSLALPMLTEHVLSHARQFYGKEMQKDDITFVLARKNLETEIVISDKHDEFNVLNILGKYAPYGLNFLIGQNAPRIEEEKAIILQKIRNPIEDFMGLKPYLKKEAHENIHKLKLSHSLEISGIIEQAIALFKFDHFFDSPTDYLKLMANELLMNAFYNANPAHHLIPRSTEVHEEDIEKAITLSIGADEQGVFLSVKDFYGTLKKEHVISSLIRGLSEKSPLNEKDNKSGGAGLGLTMTFNHCNIFIVNSSPLKSTEIIVGIEYNKRFKKYKERITSFHFFVF